MGGGRRGISKGGGSREKWEKFRNIGTIFCNRKSTQGRELLWKGAGSGSAGCGRRKVQTPPVPPPPTNYTAYYVLSLGALLGEAWVFCILLIFGLTIPHPPNFKIILSLYPEFPNLISWILFSQFPVLLSFSPKHSVSLYCGTFDLTNLYITKSLV